MLWSCLAAADLAPHAEASLHPILAILQACTLYWLFCKPALYWPGFIVFAANRVKKWNVWPIHILKMNFETFQFQNVLKRVSLEKRGHFRWVPCWRKFSRDWDEFSFWDSVEFQLRWNCTVCIWPIQPWIYCGQHICLWFWKTFQNKICKTKRNQQVFPGWPRSDTF